MCVCVCVGVVVVVLGGRVLAVFLLLGVFRASQMERRTSQFDQIDRNKASE